MDFEQLESLRRNDPAWRLLRADNAALMLSFMGRVFVEDNVRSISAAELIGRLDDELYALNERLGEQAFPKSAKQYLDDWSAPERGWLRKFYPPDSDEVHFDATPAAEKALSWAESLRHRPFVGTESRLNTVFDLLRQMVFGAETDPHARLEDLHRRRAALDEEIQQVERGDFAVLDDSAQRDRYQQFSATARELLADFREVEANFRDLDRGLREQIAGWEGGKGELLDEVVGSRSSIAESDQGRSFQAFYDLLLSHERQEELNELLEKVAELEAVEDSDARMRYIHHDWLDAAERTQSTVRLLSEQLRRFLDDQTWLENRRVMDVLRSIEAAALKLREQRGPAVTTELDGTAPTVALPMERPLYAPREKAALTSTDITEGDADSDASVLFEQVHVDREVLGDAVRARLRGRDQVGLGELLRHRPLEQGLAELVGYFSLSDPTFEVVFDEAVREEVHWTDETGAPRRAAIPQVTFTRNRTVVEDS
ncbi:DUF3375 domain-containing protein [Saccharopolyspora sp. NPDC049426]|uniref:DUF3375 domain-containing protein n=1 Tax=Saccharopolyspora sp. NPDC049426 TaxID=3155652 RepID=UPI00342B1436